MVHEAEITRQHARYKIPAILEIEGREFRVYDWSVSGCAVIGLPESMAGKFAEGRLKFRFDDFVTVVDHIKLEFLHKHFIKESQPILGARFTELTPQQSAILNHIISAYLEGDIVTQDDIIHAVSRQMKYEKRKPKEIESTKAMGILGVIYVTIAVLLAFLGYVFYQRTFVVRSLSGFIAAPLVTVRAPAPSYIEIPKNVVLNKRVDRSSAVAVAHFVNGGMKVIDAPCQGRIVKIFARDGVFKNVAESVLSIFPKGASFYVLAHFDRKKAEKLRVGQIATVTKADGTRLRAKLVSLEYPVDEASQKSSAKLAGGSQGITYAVGILEPLDRSIDIKDLNTFVSVAIDTF